MAKQRIPRSSRNFLFLILSLASYGKIHSFQTLPAAPQPMIARSHPHFQCRHRSGLDSQQGPRRIASKLMLPFSKGVVYRPSLVTLQSAQNDVDDPKRNSFSLSSGLMIALPFLSCVFPLLLEAAQGAVKNSPEQFAIVTALFVSNRVYLYALAMTIVALAAQRGRNDDPRLGERMVRLTEEVLYAPDLEESGAKESISKDRPAMIQSLSEEIGDSLDQVSDSTQAVVLPILVSALLAASFFFLQITNVAPGSVSTGVDTNLFKDLFASIAAYLPELSKFWNIGILAIFSRCEFRRLLSELGMKNEIIPWIAGFAVTLTAFAGVWPAQNFVNMALAVLVARAIQLPSFAAILGALSLLTVYDAASVLLIQPAGAVELDPMLVSDASNSAMGAVAMNKLTGGQFQPGLLVTRIGSGLGGALGLGDAVFPSILAIFAKRYDDSKGHSGISSLFALSLLGYGVGCAACEFVPFISTTGVPALVFLLPSMLVAVVLGALGKDEFEDLWEFQPENDSE